MKISLNWIREFVDVPSKLKGDELGRLFTTHTAEVEGVEDQERLFENMVVGQVLNIKKHPGADRLSLAEVNVGTPQSVQIVCGGQNLKEGMLVAVALPGARVKWHGEGEPVQMQEAKIRGEKSFGMICAGEEIGLAADNSPDGKGVRIHDLTWSKAKPGTELAKALGKDDVVLEIDNKSLTHRADLWGHYGVAREFAAIFRKELKSLDQFLKYKTGGGSSKLKIDLTDSSQCDRFSGAILSGIKIEESPAWMKARLLAAGMNPHNNIIDITNYVMLELGQPMHAYDRKVVGSDFLKVRAAKKGEKLVTLDETEQKLHPEDILVCNEKDEALGLAGVKGGLKSGVSVETTDIILEAAHFDPVLVRKSSTQSQLRTEASQRFEKGPDPGMTDKAVARAVHLIQELCPGAKLVSNITTVGTWKPKKIILKVDADRISNKIGVALSAKEITRLLTALSFGVTGNGKTLSVEVPSHRQGEVDLEEDIVEEVARLYGYNQIPALLPELPIELPMENKERSLEHRARGILAKTLGFTELINYSFYSKDRLDKCLLPEDGHYRVLNYLSEEQTHMRMKMIPNLLAKLAENAREHECMKVFELGRTYKDVGHFMPLEQKVLIAAVAVKGEPFYEAKGALEAFFKEFGVQNYKLKPSKELAPYVHPKKSADVWINDRMAGTLFDVNPLVLNNFDLRQNVAAFALRFSALQEPVLKLFEALPRFPGINLDVSVLVPERTEVATVEKLIWEASKRFEKNAELLRSVELFDIYRGKEIPVGQKSLSFRIRLRRDSSTLTDQDAADIGDVIFLALQQFGATIRGL